MDISCPKCYLASDLILGDQLLDPLILRPGGPGPISCRSASAMFHNIGFSDSHTWIMSRTYDSRKIARKRFTRPCTIVSDYPPGTPTFTPAGLKMNRPQARIHFRSKWFKKAFSAFDVGEHIKWVILHPTLEILIPDAVRISKCMTNTY